MALCDRDPCDRSCRLPLTSKRLRDRNKSPRPWVFLFLVLPLTADFVAVASMELMSTDFRTMLDTILAVRDEPGSFGTGARFNAAYAIFCASTTVSIILTVWAIVELGFRRGTAGPNRFGPDPRDGAAR